MTDNQQQDTSQRLEYVERSMRTMRLAIIVIAAFFIYQAIAPSGLGKGEVEVRNTVKLKELVIIDGQGNEWARLGAANDGGVLVLSNEVGERLKVFPDSIRMLKADGDDYMERLRIDADQPSEVSPSDY